MITSPPIGQKTSMVVTDNAGQQRLELVGNDFGDDLVKCITKTNRPKVLKTLWIVNFGDHTEKSLVKLMVDRGRVESIFTKIDELIA